MGRCRANRVVSVSGFRRRGQLPLRRVLKSDYSPGIRHRREAVSSTWPANLLAKPSRSRLTEHAFLTQEGDSICGRVCDQTPLGDFIGFRNLLPCITRAQLIHPFRRFVKHCLMEDSPPFQVTTSGQKLVRSIADLSRAAWCSARCADLVQLFACAHRRSIPDWQQPHQSRLPSSLISSLSAHPTPARTRTSRGEGHLTGIASPTGARYPIDLISRSG